MVNLKQIKHQYLHSQPESENNSAKGGIEMSTIDLISVIVWDYMWGMPLVLIILASGLYLTLRTGCFQITGFSIAMRSTWSNIRGKDKEKNKTGVMSSIEAKCAVGNLSSSILITAKSVIGSVPINLALYVFLS